ncbi:hypothetical protein NC651_019723 [Populus alba x Populus x berolinensis]|nr:hypothetical protein NC651_019723 [Populus alba x Populus x berolinensis]
MSLFKSIFAKNYHVLNKHTHRSSCLPLKTPFCNSVQWSRHNQVLTSETTSYVPTPNLASASVPPMYAAFSTPKGRFLSDLFLYRKPRGEEKLDGSGSGPCGDLELFADVDNSVLDELLQTFKNGSHLRLSLAIKQKSKITCYGELRMRLQKAQLRFPKVEAIRPKRWPAEWFSEHQQHGAVKG